MKLILLGAPGAGKGTQAEFISQRLNIPTISTGNILRAAMKEGTPLGHRVTEYMVAGKLVPDDIIIDIITERLNESDCANGYILDGVPRTIVQAEAMDAAGIKFDAVLSFEIDDSIIVERMSGRRACTKCGATYHVHNAPPKTEGKCDRCGSDLVQREDDKEETVLRRLRIYHENTAPLERYYEAKGNLKHVEAQPTIEATTKLVFEILGI